ncbi:GNAT family N-acetyltransferase [Vibrio maerlii]|uniref:GNAT family N-acetyltransferase n=1 Tax=Vibrio maerlii TaxID=2231648 RepID=UPI000E3C4057|nr:GNAT family N-acetyltransferase [Vibrio maerlii]
MFIRTARLDDLEQLNTMMFKLHEEHHQQQPNLFKSAVDIEQEKSIGRYLDDPECLVYVACDYDDQLFGFVTGHFCELVSTVSKPVQMGSIDELYITPDQRRNGLAMKLVSRLEQTFEEYGVQQVFVEVWAFNQSAIEFYQSNQFDHHIHWLRKPIKASE